MEGGGDSRSLYSPIFQSVLVEGEGRERENKKSEIASIGGEST